MGLYRQIAGENLGLFLEAADVEMTNGGGGGGGGQVFYDPGFPIPAPIPTTLPVITPSQPLQPDDQPANVIPTNGTTSDNPVNSNTTVTEAVQAATTNTTPPAPKKKNYMPLLTLGALVFTMVKGDQVLKQHRGIAFLGGLGALFYELSQTENQGTTTPIT